MLGKRLVTCASAFPNVAFSLLALLRHLHNHHIHDPALAERVLRARKRWVVKRPGWYSAPDSIRLEWFVVSNKLWCVLC